MIRSFRHNENPSDCVTIRNSGRDRDLGLALLCFGIDRYISTLVDELNCAKGDAVALEALFTDTVGGSSVPPKRCRPMGIYPPPLMETLALVGNVGPSAKQLSAIKQFFRATEKLRHADVIRSHRFLGDLGEFLCACTFGITLVPNQREVGLDGHRGVSRAQIKYHGGKSTTADLGNPKSYDEVYLVLGPGSVLRRKDDTDGFLVYRFLSKNVKKRKTNGGKYQVSKGGLPAKPVKRILMTP